MTNPYETRLEARRERLEARADKAAGNARAKFDRAMSHIAGIEPGQPILVGHHSERRHRRDLERHDNAMRAAIAEDKKAAHYADRAAAVGTGGISSDDPEAVDKLNAKLARLEAAQAFMVEANRHVRRVKAGKAEISAVTARLQELRPNWTDDQSRELMSPDFCGRTGFPSYATSNNNAEIHRVKARIATLQRAAEAEHKETEHPSGVRVVEDPEANRLRLYFPGKPDDATRAALKSFGFRWARSEGAWQRHLSNAARWAAESVLAKLEG